MLMDLGNPGPSLQLASNTQAPLLLGREQAWCAMSILTLNWRRPTWLSLEPVKPSTRVACCNCLAKASVQRSSAPQARTGDLGTENTSRTMLNANRCRVLAAEPLTFLIMQSSATW